MSIEPVVTKGRGRITDIKTNRQISKHANSSANTVGIDRERQLIIQTDR
jgi:hypothetical protein